jgi:transposase
MYTSEMSYKKIAKNQGVIMARYRVLRAVKLNQNSNTQVAQQFGMHRNSVGNIVSIYEQNKNELSEKILN